MQIDITQIEHIIAEVAAQEIMPRFRKLAEGDVMMKGVNDPVTVADQAAEKELVKRLTTAYPGSVVVGEETFAEDPSILAHLGGDKPVWVIDPIDGTRNFVEGRAEFGTMVGLVHNGKTVAGWIHDPGTGDTLMGEQGGGVWLRGKKMRLADVSLGIIGSRLRRLLSKPENKALLDQMPDLVTGSAAAFDYGRLFTGEALFAGSSQNRAAYLAYRNSKPWDHVPGLFMHAEAGGYAACLDRRPYDAASPDNAGLLVAPHKEGWEQLHGQLSPLIDALLPM